MIVGLGCIAHDDVLFTGATWDQGKGRVTGRVARFGGNVRNALVTIAAMGDTPGYLACIGTSDLGEQAVQDLVDHGVSLDFVERIPGADPVTSTLVIAADGERFIAFDDAALATTPMPDASTVHAALDAATVLLVDACTAPPGTLEVMRAARQRGIPVVVDAERDPSDDLREMVDAADHVIVPAIFARALTGLPTSEAAGEAIWNCDRAVVILTEGQDGSQVWTGPGEFTTVPAFEVTVVDTTGCGDAFHGAYAWGLHRGMELRARVQLASAAAACLAEARAGETRIPRRDRLVELSGLDVG
jgi:sulfofructose kinase